MLIVGLHKYLRFGLRHGFPFSLSPFYFTSFFSRKDSSRRRSCTNVPVFFPSFLWGFIWIIIFQFSGNVTKKARSSEHSLAELISGHGEVLLNCGCLVSVSIWLYHCLSTPWRCLRIHPESVTLCINLCVCGSIPVLLSSLTRRSLSTQSSSLSISAQKYNSLVKCNVWGRLDGFISCRRGGWVIGFFPLGRCPSSGKTTHLLLFVLLSTKTIRERVVFLC